MGRDRGAGPIETALVTLEARPPSVSETRGAIASPQCQPRRHNQNPITTPMTNSETKLPIVLRNRAAVDQPVGSVIDEPVQH